MMKRGLLRLTIRTPSETVIDDEVTSLRVPTVSGQVGLRPRGEPTVLPIESGLIRIRVNGSVRYAGTAGGLLHTTADTVSMLTPLAVVGNDIKSVSSELDQLLSQPNEEMEARRSLGQLETRIMQELRHDDTTIGRPPGSRS